MVGSGLRESCVGRSMNASMLGPILVRWELWRASFFGLVGARAGTNDSRCMKSIALVATALLVVLGHRGDAASLLPKPMASTFDSSAGQTQTNKTNVARQCAATWSPVLQCHIDPDRREKQQTCQLYRLGYGGSPMICHKVTKCKEHCVGLRTAPGLTEAVSAVVARWGLPDP
jgi:hypothetical protein